MKCSAPFYHFISIELIRSYSPILSQQFYCSTHQFHFLENQNKLTIFVIKTKIQPKMSDPYLYEIMGQISFHNFENSTELLF